MKKLLFRRFLLLMIPFVTIPNGNDNSGWVFANAPSDKTNLTSEEPYSTIRIPRAGDVEEYVFFAFDPSTGDIYLLNWRSKQLTRYTEQGDSEVIALTGDEIPSTLVIDIRRNRVSDEPELYLWDSGIGRVFTVDTKTGIVTRVDKSFDHRNMYYHASYVSEQNEIHAMGGYGFWRYKNFLITYYPESNEWLEESQTNNEIVYEGIYGSLFRTETAFFYYVKDAYSAEQGMFRMDLQSRRWERYTLFDELLDRKSGSGFEGFPKLRQTSTYQIDQEKGAMLFYFRESRLPKIIKMNSKENSLYEVDLLLFNVDKVFALFYSKRLDKWVMIYESSANSKQDNLYVTTLSVDSEESYVKPLVPDTSSSWTALHYSLLSFGILLFITVGGFYWVRRRDGQKESRIPPTNSATTESDFNPLVLSSDGKTITASIQGKELILPGLQQNQGQVLYKLLYDTMAKKINEIPVTVFDEKMFPGDPSSQASTKRKRLFLSLSQELGFDLFEERKMVLDGRYKMLLLRTENIKIVEKSS